MSDLDQVRDARKHQARRFAHSFAEEVWGGGKGSGKGDETGKDKKPDKPHEFTDVCPKSTTTEYIESTADVRPHNDVPSQNHTSRGRGHG